MTKHAVVTGAASGIGLDCCRDLLLRGWTVYGLDRSEGGLQNAQRTLSAVSGLFLPFPCDVSDSAEIAKVFSAIGAETDVVDAFICSAGIFRTGPLMACERKISTLYSPLIRKEHG